MSAAQPVKNVTLLLVVLSLWAGASHAQFLERETAIIPIKVGGTFIPAVYEERDEDDNLVSTSYGSMGIVVGNKSFTAQAEEPGEQEVLFTTEVTPGRVYYISADATDQVTGITVSVPPGYSAFLDDRRRARLTGVPFDLVKLVVSPNEITPFGHASAFQMGRVVWQVGLGTLSNGQSAGVLSARKKQDPYAAYMLITPEDLVYENSSPEVERLPATGTIRQIYLPNGLVEVTPRDPGFGFRIKFFTRIQVSSKVNGYYQTVGTPLFEYFVQEAYERVQIQRVTTQGGASESAGILMMRTAGPPEVFEMHDWNRSVTKLVRTLPSPNDFPATTTEETTISRAGVDAFKEKRLYRNGQLYSREIGDAAISSELKTTYAYTYSHDRLVSETDALGTTTHFAYYANGAKGGSTAVFPDGSTRRVGVAGIVTDWYGAFVLPGSEIIQEAGPTGPASAETGYWYALESIQDFSRDVNSANPAAYANASNAMMNLMVTTTKQYFEDAAGHYSTNPKHLTTVVKAFREDSDPQFGFFQRLPHSVSKPDGSMTVNLYYRGTFDISSSGPTARQFVPQKGGPEVLRLAIHGYNGSVPGALALPGYAIGAPVASSQSDQLQPAEANFHILPGVTTAEAVVMSADNRPICEVSLICVPVGAGFEWRIARRDVHTYADGRYLAQTTRDSGNAGFVWTVASNTWRRGKLDSSIDESGIETKYEYWPAVYGDKVFRKRKTGIVGLGATLPELVVEYEYDALGNATRETEAGCTTARVYDLAGRLVTETKPGFDTQYPTQLAVTSYVYDVAGRRTIATSPTGGTTITERRPDGRVKSITGTAVVAEYHAYSVESDGRTKETINYGAVDSLRKKEVWRDMLGRESEARTPAFGPSSLESKTLRTYYEDTRGMPVAYTGRVNKVLESGIAQKLYSYTADGRTVLSGLDGDGSGTLDMNAVADRITGTSERYEQDGEWFLTTTTWNYPHDGTITAASTPKEISKQWTRITGLGASATGGSLRSEVRTRDADGGVSTVQTVIDPATRIKQVRHERQGIGSPKLEYFVNEMLVESVGHDGVLLKRRYDSVGRLTRIIDPRTSTLLPGGELSGMVTTYHEGTTWPRETTDAAGYRLSRYDYDAAGRVVVSRDASNRTTRTSYTSRSEVQHIWGTAIYPASYGYNSYGERTTMRTYRDASGVSLADSSTFPSLGAYDETIWEFDVPSGLLKKKIDAAGKGVEYTYNIRGEVYERFWSRLVPGSSPAARMKATYAYNAITGESMGVAYNDGTPSINYSYTRLGQVEAIEQREPGSNALLRAHDFVYDPSYPHRLYTEAFDGFYGNRVLTRLYDSSPGAVVGRNRGFKLGSAVGSNSELEQNYGYSAGTGRFGTLSSGRNSNATSRTFNYGFEPNSNLLKTLWTNDNDFFVTRTFEAGRDVLVTIDSRWGQGATNSLAKYNYVSNDLRQRQSVEQAGDAFAGYYPTATIHQTFTYNDRSELKAGPTKLGTVSAPGAAIANRQHEFDYDAIGNRKYAGVTGNSADRKTYAADALNQYSSRQNSVVPFGGTQSFTYDDDGNVLTDGLWTYTWDAENRLVRMVSSLPSGQGHTRLELNFKYDYLGRRVEKKVVNLDGPTPNYTRRFLYDGWNLVAEYDYAGGTLTLKRSYTWGLDIATDLAKAGGVGALVQIVDHGTGSSYHPAFDGNGNVIALVNGIGGAIAAAYEYSPFGEVLRVVGTYGSSNPFRFSTKFTDDETGLVYYGHRYYDPSQGRFLGRDPAQEEGGPNLYGFCRNNSINLWDYLGLKLVWGPIPDAEGGYSGEGWYDDGLPEDGIKSQIDGILYNNALTTVVDDTVILDLMAMRPRTAPGVVYSQSDLNAPFDLAKVYEMLSRTAQGQVLVDRLKQVEIRSFTAVDAEGRDPTTGEVVERKRETNYAGTTARSGLAPGEVGGVIYVNAGLTNKQAIETLFHELQHYNGLPGTPANEQAIRINQTQFMINIGMTTMIPGAVTAPPAGSPPGTAPTINPGAITASIPPSYSLVWVLERGGVFHDNKLLQPAPPKP